MASNSTAAMCLPRQLVAPFVQRVKKCLPKPMIKRVKLTYTHDTLPVIFSFRFRWEKIEREVYDKSADAQATPQGKGRIIHQYEPIMEKVYMIALEDDGTRREFPESLDVDDNDLVDIEVDYDTNMWRYYRHRHKTCECIKLHFGTAYDRSFQDALSNNVGLEDMWAGEYVPIITDSFCVNTNTLRIDYAIPDSEEDWNIKIEYFGY